MCNDTDEDVTENILTTFSGHKSQLIKKNPYHDSRKLIFAIFENFTNHGESIWAINRGSHENKPNTTITDHEQKWWKREKIMYGWQWKGEWGSDEITMCLTLPWTMC